MLTEQAVAAWYQSSFRREPEALAAKEAMRLARFLDVLYERPAVVKTIGVNSFTIEERLWNRASKR